MILNPRVELKQKEETEKHNVRIHCMTAHEWKTDTHKHTFGPHHAICDLTEHQAKH